MFRPMVNYVNKKVLKKPFLTTFSVPKIQVSIPVFQQGPFSKLKQTSYGSASSSFKPLALGMINFSRPLTIAQNSSVSSNGLQTVIFESALQDIARLRHQQSTCFISYAWGHTLNENTVHRLAADLAAAGVRVFLDKGIGPSVKRDNRPGTRISRFTENIEAVNYVVVAGSLKLMEKYRNEQSGSVINSELGQISNKLIKQPGSVIPLLLDGTFETAIPPFLRDVAGFDFRNIADYSVLTFELLKRLLPNSEQEIEQIRLNYVKELALLEQIPEEVHKFSEEIEKLNQQESKNIQDTLIIKVNDWLAQKKNEINERKLKADHPESIEGDLTQSQEAQQSKDRSFFRTKFWEKLFFAGVVSTIAYAVKEYHHYNDQLDSLSEECEAQALKNRNLLEEKRALQVQPRLFLTTSITGEDKLKHQEDEDKINQQMGALKAQSAKLLNLESKLTESLPRLPIFNRNKLFERLKNLQMNITYQLEALEIAKAFNKAILLQKERQYTVALREIEEKVILKLEGSLKNETRSNRVFDPKHILTAAYNAQAKLYACLSKTLATEAERHVNSDKSVRSYHKALELSDKPNAERAILLSSLAYLHNDRHEPELSLPLRKEALKLKPNDEHITCGIGLDLHHIEKRKEASPRDLEKLKGACGYFTKALAINDKEPNIYVSRGQLLVDMKEDKAALADFNRALEIDKDHSAAHFEKSQLLLKMGQCESAKNAFANALLALRPFITEEVLRKQMGDCEANLKTPCSPISQLTLFDLQRQGKVDKLGGAISVFKNVGLNNKP